MTILLNVTVTLNLVAFILNMRAYLHYRRLLKALRGTEADLLKLLDLAEQIRALPEKGDSHPTK